MKKPRIPPLILLTALFAVFTLGFLLGRNCNHATVQTTAAARYAAGTAHTLATDPTPSDTAETTEATQPGKVNINTATADAFATLPGIGPVLAQRIVDYREENGDFATVYDLMNVSGIGEKKLQAILELITTGG